MEMMIIFLLRIWFQLIRPISSTKFLVLWMWGWGREIGHSTDNETGWYMKKREDDDEGGWVGEENNKPVGFFSERHFVLRVYFDIKAKQKTSQSSTWSSSSPSSSSSLLSFFFPFFLPCIVFCSFSLSLLHFSLALVRENARKEEEKKNEKRNISYFSSDFRWSRLEKNL